MYRTGRILDQVAVIALGVIEIQIVHIAPLDPGHAVVQVGELEQTQTVRILGVEPAEVQNVISRIRRGSSMLWLLLALSVALIAYAA